VSALFFQVPRLQNMGDWQPRDTCLEVGCGFFRYGLCCCRHKVLLLYRHFGSLLWLLWANTKFLRLPEIQDDNFFGWGGITLPTFCF